MDPKEVLDQVLNSTLETLCENPEKLSFSRSDCFHFEFEKLDEELGLDNLQASFKEILNTELIGRTKSSKKSPDFDWLPEYMSWFNKTIENLSSGSK